MIAIVNVPWKRPAESKAWTTELDARLRQLVLSVAETPDIELDWRQIALQLGMSEIECVNRW